MQLIAPRHSSAAVLVALTLMLVVAGSAQQAPSPPQGISLLDEPQTFTSRELQFRVVPLKGSPTPGGWHSCPTATC